VGLKARTHGAAAKIALSSPAPVRPVSSGPPGYSRAQLSSGTFITDARPEDLAAIVAIYNASIPGRRATADLEPVAVEDRLVWFRRHSERRPLWAAQADGAVAGWLSFETFYGRPAYHRTAEVSVYVAPEWQGRGVGSELLAEAIKRAPALGLAVLLGFIFGHNVASLALFDRFGFEVSGRLPLVAELDGVLRDLVIVSRAVP
jgi:L-amino acid N-acyltransferase YncA